MERVAIVTGGGRGIGASTAAALCREGYSVCVNYQSNHARAQEVVGAIGRAGGRAIAVAADIGIEEDVIRLFETVDRKLGPLHALVNNAGIMGPVGRTEAASGDDLALLYRTNVFGTTLCCREAVRRMSIRNGGAGGVIVNLGSVVARIGGAGEFTPYAASKGAIESLTFSLAQEVAAEGIRVVGISPGIIETEFLPPGRLERIGPMLPMKRAGKADEVAEAIVWALSDKASYVSATSIGVTGAR